MYVVSPGSLKALQSVAVAFYRQFLLYLIKVVNVSLLEFNLIPIHV